MPKSVMLPYKMPMFTGSNRDICPLGVLACTEQYNTWMFQQYSSFYMLTNEAGYIWPYIEFDNIMGLITPLRYYYKHKNSFIDVISEISDLLLKGRYVYLYCDLYHIESSSVYHNYHKAGEVFLVGLDESSKCFFTRIYTEDYQYKEYSISFDEIKNAFYTEIFENQCGHEPQNLVTVFQPDSQWSCSYDYEALLIELSSLVDGVKPKEFIPAKPVLPNITFADEVSAQEYSEVYNHARSFFNRYEMYYGLENYTFVSQILRQKLQTEELDQYSISGWPNMFFEHAVCLAFKADIMISHVGRALPDLEVHKDNMMKSAKNLKNKAIKFNLTKSEKTFSRMIDNLSAMKELDAALCEQMCRVLTNM